MLHVYIVPTDRIASFVGSRLVSQLCSCPDSILGLATGSTPVLLYRDWASRVAAGEMSFSQVISFNLDEYIGLSMNHNQSYRFYMEHNLFQHIDIRPAYAHVPNGEATDLDKECRRYDSLIEQAGGIDWQLLGIGLNGHVGFNEPGPALQAGTHVVELSEQTREANARFFSSMNEVPRQAITVGMGSILKSRHIVMVATGIDKAEIVFKALMGPVTTDVPASFLQLHNDVVIVMDEAAASLLSNQEDQHGRQFHHMSKETSFQESPL